MKISARIVVKIDKTKNAEEILLTSLVVVYALFDLWLIAVDFFNFSLISNFRYTIPFLIAAGLGYNDIAVRDYGLALITFSVVLGGSDVWCLDKKLHQV